MFLENSYSYKKNPIENRIITNNQKQKNGYDLYYFVSRDKKYFLKKFVKGDLKNTKDTLKKT